MFRNLAERDLRPEVMDQPDLKPERHLQALAGLARVNAVSGVARTVWRPVRRLAKRLRTSELSVLDIASGGGDVALALQRRARRAGLQLRVTGYDISPCAVEEARRRAAATSAHAEFHVRNIFTSSDDDGASSERFDVVMCSLFLHHLDEAQAVELLRRMATRARRLVVVNDLVRGRIGYTAAHIVVRLITRSDVVHYDGPQSVAGAFTLKEVRRLAVQAGLHDAELRKTWPFRFMLTWEPDR